VDLTWNPVTSTSIDVYRDGAVIATVPPNTGAYTDSTGQHGRATYTYRVCDGLLGCSNNATVSFGGGH